MSTARTLWTALVLATLTAGVADVSADPVPLTGDEIRAWVKGKRIGGQRAGVSLRMRFADDGGLSIQEGHAVESGRWSVEGDTLCIKVSKWGYDGCGKVTPSDSAVLVEKAGGGELLVLNR